MIPVTEKRAISEVAGTMVLSGVITVGMIVVNLVIFTHLCQGMEGWTMWVPSGNTRWKEREYLAGCGNR